MDNEKLKYYVFDIDGTLANADQRLHNIRRTDGKKKDWHSFYTDCVKDKPIAAMCTLASTLIDGSYGEFGIIFCTGRPEKYRAETLKWLKNNVHVDIESSALFMRPNGNFEKDKDIKFKILGKAGINPEDILMAFEDRKQMTEAYREKDVLCAQVAEGDF
jgi:hypothetical protein